MVLAEPAFPMWFASRWCGAAGSGRRALHFWWSVEWLRESPPPYLAISLQRVAVGAGGRRGFAVAAMVVTPSHPGGRRGSVWSPSVLPSVAEDAASVCSGVPHGDADGGHGCGLLSDAR
jgi:hypothetical protein